MSILTDTAPKRIYLCVSDDADDYDLPYPEVYGEDEPITWAPDQPVACTVEYVRADLAAALALLPGVYYMDPPDGGNVDLIEQLRRMANDAARYRWLRDCPDLLLRSERSRWKNKDGREFISTHYLAAHGKQFASSDSLDATIDSALAGEEK